jgi:hypothetical protein
LAPLATYAIGNDDGAIGGKMCDFLLSLIVLSHQPTNKGGRQQIKDARRNWDAEFSDCDDCDWSLRSADY